MNNLNWRKASYSGGGSGSDCVEVADAANAVMVRDTANRDGGVLAFTSSAWLRLVDEVRSGRIA